jgi:hypothetical protein
LIADLLGVVPWKRQLDHRQLHRAALHPNPLLADQLSQQFTSSLRRHLTYDTLRGYFTSSSDALPVNIFDGHLRIDAIQGHDVAHSPGRREMYHSLLEAPSSRVRRGFAIYNNWQSSHGLLTLPQGSSCQRGWGQLCLTMGSDPGTCFNVHIPIHYCLIFWSQWGTRQTYR